MFLRCVDLEVPEVKVIYYYFKIFVKKMYILIKYTNLMLLIKMEDARRSGNLYSLLNNCT